MIIKFPTGLYRDVLPINPQDSGNITFTISNTSPPRTNLLFPKIPAGLIVRSENRPVNDLINNRKFLGDLIFSVSSTKRQIAGNNSRQFEIGQVLDFSNQETKSVEPMVVNPITEIQHNTNIFDYETLGITEAEQAIIATESLLRYDSLSTELNDLKRKRADTEVVINTQQKVINETNRTINGLAIVAETSDDVKALVVKLTKKRDAAYAIRDQAITDANTYAIQSEDILNQLRAVAVVVK
jgi:hypothetical protein